jgi:hypothetical protein
MDVVGHDDPRPQIVFLPNALTQQQSLGDTRRYPRLLEPARTRAGAIQAAVLSYEALPFDWQAAGLFRLKCLVG